MALDKPSLKNGIKSLLNTLYEQQENPGDAREAFAEQLSTLIDTFVKSGTVNTTVATNAPATGTGVGAIT